tara:strand:- start:14593 stop:16674 length:2082 start_codon:yes stop_codon:yes gene_type:complete
MIKPFDMTKIYKQYLLFNKMVIKIILVFVLTIFLVSFASSEIIIDQQPKESYNLGETIDLSITLTSTNGIYDYLKTSMICENHIHSFPEKQISLAANEVIKIPKSIFLIEKFVGNSLGDCKIKAWFQDTIENYVFSEEFKILNSISIELNIEKTEFIPEERVLVKGVATKGINKFVDGFIDLSFVLSNSSENKTYQGVIEDGIFSIDFELPNNIGAGKYLLNLNAYEKDPLETITNKGFASVNIQVNQVPTSLEIVFENQEVEPGTNLKVKSILHDQTGQKMDSNVIISVKDRDNKILEQMEKPTDEFLEYPILYNEPAGEWTIVAVSAKFSSEANFNIKEKADIKIELINKTVILTNIGNVIYDKIILVKVGEETLNINASLEVDEVKKYILSAPDGEYSIEILTEGESKSTGSVALTGNSINIREASSNIVSLAKYPLAWFFMVFILGFVAFMIFRKGYKKSFFGHINLKGKEGGSIFSSTNKASKNGLIQTKNKAEISLSLSGEKQKASVICLKIKNFKEIEKKSDTIKETLDKLGKIVEEDRGFVYENNEDLFIILSPVITKTFDNEKSALRLTQKIVKILNEHNKLFRQKINFGVSLNSGEIISKKEEGVLKFMSFGNLIINAKKIAALSNSEVYLNEKMKEKLMNHAKIEKHKKQGIDVYTVKEMKDKGEHKKFITEFIKRLEKKDK